MGKERVSARRGWAGEKSDFLSILLEKNERAWMNHLKPVRRPHIDQHECPPKRQNQAISVLSISCVEPNKPERPDKPDRRDGSDVRHAPRNQHGVKR
jgi:hypothetical protein